MNDIEKLQNYQPKNKIRILTSTSLFDGHDASINIIRRLLQARGVEIIHLGHNRSATEVVKAAIEEDVQAISLSSYQGGHNEYLAYIKKLLAEYGSQDKLIFAGGGGVISLEEVENLHKLGVTRIYTPEDGQRLGLTGIIGDIVKKSDYSYEKLVDKSLQKTSLARKLTLLENSLYKPQKKNKKRSLVIGVTGTGGAGKSSLLDELLLRFVEDFPHIKIACICVDPSKKQTGGALLGDRIRVNSASCENVFFRSFATRQHGSELSRICQDAVDVIQDENLYDLVFVETSGIGQGDSGITEISDISLYVMTPEYGASSQLEKIDMLDLADFVVINKFERRQGLDAFLDVKTLMRRNRFAGVEQAESSYPLFATIASRFNDDGTNALYEGLLKKINNPNLKPSKKKSSQCSSNRDSLLDNHKQNYLFEIAESVINYHKKVEEQANLVGHVDSLSQTQKLVPNSQEIANKIKEITLNLSDSSKDLLSKWDKTKESYEKESISSKIRDKEITITTVFTSITEKKYPKVCLPKFKSKEDLFLFLSKENLPGYFPFTGGLFPFRRSWEDPKRQFAGEGGPKRTNLRFHYLSKDDQAKRLSVAFDSVTLYGADPAPEPDIFGKVGESGVSIASLFDMKELFSGFDLCDPATSVSMTINGPAPIILAMFFAAATDQQVEKYEKASGLKVDEKIFAKIQQETLQKVRGTVQADILKEDQAQNTCIFSTEFALKMMADVQEYFVQNKIKKYYAVSISGYHIAEAGANPITQLAFTLANGFTYVEYYLKRGLKIDDFVSNLSFFFSNGIDAEYAVLGRVARRIWAIAMRDYYKADKKSQKLKYHIQTSGRSLHAQEMSFNDIRTTLQALMALNDNCNSLHTNAYDEALTTPSKQSVRQAMAIQLIIQKELGMQKCENFNQGSFFIEELTDKVEKAVLSEFKRISERGGVLGAMETQYQRRKIQEESLYYESLKDSKKIPIIGVNTFLSKDQDHKGREDTSLTRASYEEKSAQIKAVQNFQEENKEKKQEALHRLKQVVIEEKNIFSELVSTVRFCSLGEITQALYQVGGEYRRSM
jgi:isobutyryl-CoA mutase